MEEERVKVGPFVLSETLGVGGMAEVFRGEHAGLQRDVAVKVITGNWALDPWYHDRFIREVQAVARLAHPAIIRVLDFGRVETSSDAHVPAGSPYLVMELADRGSLEDSPPLAFGRLRDILLQLLDALAYSHARDVIHRDIKPGNVLLVSQPDGSVRAKLTDFGIAHAVDPNTDMTSSSLEETAGTAAYMPPEQVQGEWRNYGPGTDLYALGCMAWEMATGEVPFPGDHMVQIALAHMTQEPPDFRPRRPVPDGFEAWLLRLLEKDPRDRFANAADAAFALSALPRLDEWQEASSGAFINPTTEESLLEDSEEATLVDQVARFDDVQSELISVGAIADSEPIDEAGDELSDPATEVLSLDDLARLAPGEERDRPPIPATWRRRESASDEDVLGVGLGLFGLREIPFVDRESERTILWNALREVGATSQPTAVVVRGATGAGKSRLVEWIARRAEEVGAARTLRAAHGPGQSSKHGLEHMWERFFVTWRMETRAEVDQRIARAIERLWADDDSADGEFIEHLAASITSIVAGADPDAMAPGTEERLVTMSRLLERLAASRPVVLWIDDAQWGDEASVLVRRVLEENDAPILVVMSVADDALRSGSPCDDTMRWMREAGRGRTVRLAPLDRDDQFELIRRAAGLEVETARRLVAATIGQPLFAVQLIGDWIDRDALRSTPQGFVLEQGADLPTDLRALWDRRIDRLVDRLGGEHDRVALELAATLGDDVSSLDWRATCILANIRPHERLVDEMVNQGLAVRFEEGWSFVHANLAETIRDGAREAGRWELLNQTCGEALRELNPDDLERVALRCAGHFIDGQAWEDALEPLIAVVRSCLATGDIPQAREFLHARGQALDALGVGRDDRRRVQNWLMAGEVMLRGGDAQGARENFERVIEAGQQSGWHVELARARRGLGEIAANSGRVRDALAEYDRAEECLAFVDDRRERAALHEARAWVWKATGENQRARRDLERALDLHREAGDTVRELNVFNRLAYTFLAEGDWTATREVAEMGVELGSQTGNRGAEAGCWTTLGEVARFQGDVEEARRCYAAAERLDELCGSRHVWVVRTNAALLELAACEWEVARDMLNRAAAGIEDVGYHWLSPFIVLGLACCAAATEDWVEYDRRWVEATTRIDEQELVERDVAWMAELLGALNEQAGDRPRSRQAYHFAMRHWEALGEVWRARDCRIQISALSRSG